MRTLGTINGEGFNCQIIEHSDGRVEFLADADIDADGANGQNNKIPAYNNTNTGSEHLANGGMAIKGGKVVGVTSWYKHIVICGRDGQPKQFPQGLIASKTSYHYPYFALDDPEAYVDSETIPYMVVPPMIITRTAGAVLGCACEALNTKTGKKSVGIVADTGPRTKVGEVSIQMARELGIPCSPRSGGTNSPIIKYTLWPGVKSTVNPVPLQRFNGKHIL